MHTLTKSNAPTHSRRPLTVEAAEQSAYQDAYLHHASDGQRRGYIKVGELTDFWIHMGTQCNLRCPSCFEGAHKGSRRLESLCLDEAVDLLYEALELGAQKFCFTGGEPFVHDAFIDILSAALNYRPCLVLTNATQPIERALPHLMALKNKPHPLSLRVSIDYPSEQAHDAGRGRGAFHRSLVNCAHLVRMGHGLSIARRKGSDEDEARIIQAYHDIFEQYGLPKETHMVAFPDLSLCAQTSNPEITEHCMTTYKTHEERQRFMCAHCLMAAKKEGQLCFYPCTLVDDDDSYILGHSLAEARRQERIVLRHQRCFTCFAHGTSCVEPT